MFKRLMARLLGGKLLERIEAKEAYEAEFGQPPMRGMTTKHIKRRTEQAKEERERNDRPIRQRHAGQQMVQDDPILNPANPLNPAYQYWDTPSGPSKAYGRYSASSCDADNSSRHHGGHDSHHSSGSYDSGSSDSGSSSSGSCD